MSINIKYTNSNYKKNATQTMYMVKEKLKQSSI